MRIAYICADPGVPVFGHKGSSIHVQSVMHALMRRGATVELFATRVGVDHSSRFAAVRSHVLPASPKGDLAIRERALIAANATLTTALEAAGPFDLIYERYALWSYAGMEYARATGTVGVLEVNAPLIDEQAEHRGLVDRDGAERVAERAFGAATVLLAVSEAVASYLDGYAAARGRVQVTPNGVDPERFPSDLQPTLPGAPGIFTVGFAGTLKPWHGLDTLLEASTTLAARMPGLRLLTVGDGPEREHLEADVRKRGLSPMVVWTGAVDPEEIPGLLRSMDVAVAPYPALPNFYFSPLKVYEYMAAGTAVVASGIGQLESLITHECNGLLCTPGNAEELAAAVERLGTDEALRKRLGSNGREMVLEHHTWDGVVDKILTVAGLGQ